MSKIKSDLEKAGKRELLAVLIFLIAECGVQIGTAKAGDETKLIIKDTSKMREALDRKLGQDNAELDKEIDHLEREKESLKQEREENTKRKMELIRKIRQRQDADKSR